MNYPFPDTEHTESPLFWLNESLQASLAIEHLRHKRFCARDGQAMFIARVALERRAELTWENFARAGVEIPELEHPIGLHGATP